MSTILHFRYWKDNERQKRGFAKSQSHFETMRSDLQGQGFHVDVYARKITYKKPQQLVKILNDIIY